MAIVLSLEEIQKQSLEVLSQFDEICTKNGFKYWLTYGTLIGAIRHNGFIPWDDDIDVMMPRDDFKRFVEFAQENERRLYPLKLHNRANTKNYWYGIPRFSNMNYKYIVEDKYEKQFDIGVFIDIYPLDNFGNTIEDAKRIFNKCRFFNRKYDWYINSISQGGFFRSLAKLILHIIVRIKEGANYSQRIDQEIVEYICQNTSNSDEFLGMVAFAGKIVRYDKRIVGDIDIVRHDFSGKQFNIPKEYDYILRQSFGDHMILPPEGERHPTHNYRVEIR